MPAMSQVVETILMLFKLNSVCSKHFQPAVHRGCTAKFMTGNGTGGWQS